MAEEETYTNSTGSIRYYRAPALFEPLGTPRKLWLPILGLAVVAAILGAIFANDFITNVVHADERQQEAIEAALASAQDPAIPLLNNYCLIEPERSRLYVTNDLGDTIYDVEDVNQDGGEYIDFVDFIKLPRSLSPEVAEAGAASGVGSLSPADAVVFLKESWRMTFSRGDIIDVRARYQDFDAASVQDAISRAISYQQWQNSVFSESGEDSMGNTYQTGSIEIEGVLFKWSVYACPLDEVFSVRGLPKGSYYVSVRMTT